MYYNAAGNRVKIPNGHATVRLLGSRVRLPHMREFAFSYEGWLMQGRFSCEKSVFRSCDIRAADVFYCLPQKKEE